MNGLRRGGTARLVIIADDLTGATDAAAQFAKCGAHTTVWIDPADAVARGDVAAFDLDTRIVAPEIAASRVRAAIEGLPANVTIVKKIDSTLRGNIASELAALLEARPRKIAIVAPAYPKNGRTQRDGIVYVCDTPVHETTFGRELLTPVRSSRIADYLPDDGTATVVTSAEGIAGAIRDGARAIAVDVERDEELAAIAALAGDERLLFVGSAGLLEALAPALVGNDGSANVRSEPSVCGPILFVIGSLSEATRRQMSRYAGSGGLTEMVDPRTVLIDEGRGRTERVAERLRATLEAGNDLLVALSSDRSDIEAALSLGRAHGYDASTTSLELRQRFVALVQPAVRLAGAIVLSGADIARSFCLAAGVRGMHLLGETAPGIPLARGLGRDVLLVPKAGGIGDDDAFGDIVASMRSAVRGRSSGRYDRRR